jgi:hypothetical protein
MLKVAVPQVGGPVSVAGEVVDRDDPKCPDGCERAHFGAAQVVLLITDRNGLPVEASRQVEALREDVARIERLEVARIPVQTNAAASRRPVSGVVPTWIFEEGHTSPRPFL